MQPPPPLRARLREEPNDEASGNSFVREKKFNGILMLRIYTISSALRDAFLVLTSPLAGGGWQGEGTQGIIHRYGKFHIEGTVSRVLLLRRRDFLQGVGIIEC